MLKKTMMLTLAVTAVAAATAPMALANWSHNHVAIPLNTDPVVQLTGQFAFTSAVIGGINCQTDTTIQLTGGTTTGHITQWAVDLTEAASTVTKKCVTSGPIAPCLVKSVQATSLPWTIHSDGADTITVTTGEIDYMLESQTGGVCGVVQQLKFKSGTLHWTITSGETCTIKEIHLSGTLQAQTGTKLAFSGSKQVIPSGAYGTLTSTENGSCV
jgi:hypothetical protein